MGFLKIKSVIIITFCALLAIIPLNLFTDISTQAQNTCQVFVVKGKTDNFTGQRVSTLQYGDDFTVFVSSPYTGTSSQAYIARVRLVIVGEGFSNSDAIEQETQRFGIFQFDGDTLLPGQTYGFNGESYPDENDPNSTLQLCNTQLTIQENPDQPAPSFTPEAPNEYTPPSLPPDFDGISINTYMNPPVIYGTTSAVFLKFTGLPTNQEIDVCFRSDQDSCIDRQEFAKSPKENKDQVGSNGEGIFDLGPICGYGASDLIVKEACDPKKDYFHEGHIYKVGLYTDHNANEAFTLTSFYVRYSYPEIYLQNEGNLKAVNATFPLDISTPDEEAIVDISQPITVTLVQKVKPGGEKNNNFQVELKSVEGRFQENQCITLKGETGSQGEVSSSFTLNEVVNQFGNIEGEYLLKVKEQVGEQSLNPFNRWGCSGGFTFYHVPVVIDSSGKITVDLRRIERDPNGEEAQHIDQITKRGPLPCHQWATIEGEPVAADNPEAYKCIEYETAIGSFGITPSGFIQTLASFILALGGVATFAYLVYGGWLILVSRGDKERIAHAREVITSAIIGLVFIVLSLVILSIIGVDVLRLPGFEREEIPRTRTNTNQNPSPTNVLGPDTDPTCGAHLQPPCNVGNSRFLCEAGFTQRGGTCYDPTLLDAR